MLAAAGVIYLRIVGKLVLAGKECLCINNAFMQTYGQR